MHKTISSYMAYGIFVVAIAVWIAVGYFGMTVTREHDAYLTRIAEAGQQTEQAAVQARLHVLAANHKDNAALMDSFIAPDAAMIVDSIKSVGSVSGVPVKISSALPGVVPKNQKDLHAVAFLIESTGSFASLMRALALFDALPVPSVIEFIDLSQEDQSAAHASPLWRMNLKIHVLTTASVTS